MKLTKTSVLLILALLLSASFVLLNFGSSILFAGHIAADRPPLCFRRS